MPGSSDLFDDRIAALFATMDYQTVLDVGAGFGKMGAIARRGKNKAARITGIDKIGRYCDGLNKSDYNEAICGDAVEWLFANPDRLFDVVTICDCLEHMRKSEGVDVLNLLTIRSKKIIIKVPMDTSESLLYQAGLNELNSESHISIWGPHDFFPFQHSYDVVSAMQYVVINGYMR